MWSKGRSDMNFQCIVGFVYCKKFAIKNFPNFLGGYGKKKPMVHWPIWVLLNTRSLNGNAFSGSIEHVFQGLDAFGLMSIDLSSNQLTGCIPGLTTGMGNFYELLQCYCKFHNLKQNRMSSENTKLIIHRFDQKLSLPFWWDYHFYKF
jgi:hypothetical protein